MHPADMAAPLEEMKKHLNSLRSTFHSIKTNPSSIQEETTLKYLAHTIQDLEIESQLSKKAKKSKIVCDLIHHFLFTPWGAPFVMSTSLLEAAQNYKFQQHKHSDLYHFVQDFINHPEPSESQIFKTLDELIDHLNDPYKKKAS